MRKIKIINNNNVTEIRHFPDGTEWNPEIWCPMCGQNRCCSADCAWFRIVEGHEEWLSGYFVGKNVAYCGHKLIGELEDAK